MSALKLFKPRRDWKILLTSEKPLSGFWDGTTPHSDGTADRVWAQEFLAEGMNGREVPNSSIHIPRLHTRCIAVNKAERECSRISGGGAARRFFRRD